MEKSIKITDILALLLLYFAAAVRLNDSLNPIALYVAIPIAFFLSFMSANSLKSNIYIRIALCLNIWIGLTYFSAEYVESADRQLKQIFGVVLLCVTISNLAVKRKLIPCLYVIYIILFVAAWLYAQHNILGVVYDFSEDRLNDDKLNANTMAYYLFYLTVALYFLGDLLQNKYVTFSFRILFIATIGISFFIAILTASRQVLIIQIPLIAILLFLRYGSFKRKSIIGLLGILTLAFIIFTYAGKDIYDNSYLKQRNERKIEDDSRLFLLKDAVRVGIENPLFGVGPGNYVHYCSRREFSHCTYTELFANTGIVGILFFVILMLVFVKRQWQRYLKFHDNTYLILLVIGLMFVFDNFFYVFYHNLWLMSFFMLLAAHSEMYFKTKYYDC